MPCVGSGFPRTALGVCAPLFAQRLFCPLVVRSVNQCLDFGAVGDLDAAPTHRVRQSRHGVIQTDHTGHQHLHCGDAGRLGPVGWIQPVLRRAHFCIQLRGIQPAQVLNAVVGKLPIEGCNARLNVCLFVIARKRFIIGYAECGIRQRRHDVWPHV